MKKVLLMVIVFLLVFSLTTPVLADDGYYIENYEVNIIVNEDATYEIEEIIDVFFVVDRHGIYRTIPTSYSNQRAIIRDVHISDSFTTTKSISETTFKIGEADIFVRGQKQYVISYVYDIGEDNIADFDQFYFNIIGPGWDTYISKVNFTVSFPKDFDQKMIWLSKGEYGSVANDLAGFKKIGYKIEGYSGRLAPYEGLTIKVELPEGYFIGARNNADITKNLAMAGWTVCLSLMVLLYLLWRKYGRNEKLFPTIQFTAPEGMTSAEVGYIVDGIVDNKDITSLIIYWADKGYLTIEELLKNKFKFTKKMIPVEGKKYEQKMFSSFFALGNGTEVTTDDLEQHFYTELPGLKQLVMWEYRGEKMIFSKKAATLSNLAIASAIIPCLFAVLVAVAGYIGMELLFATLFTSVFACIFGVIIKQFIRKWHIMSSLVKTFRIAFTVFFMGIMSVVIFLMLLLVRDSFYQSLWSTGFIILETIRTVITLSAIYILAGIMEKRTDYGHELQEKLMGLKEFIESAELDKIKTLSEENPQYFYHILPYATVLGLDRTWAKKFESMTIEAPTWYQGSFNRGFSTMIFYSHFNSFVNKTSSSMQMPKSSGSSMGGGGFSGGGAGGGGGGSW